LAGVLSVLKDMKTPAAISYAGLVVMGLAVVVALVMFLLEVIF
jgi:hypothetical protein